MYFMYIAEFLRDRRCACGCRGGWVARAQRSELFWHLQPTSASVKAACRRPTELAYGYTTTAPTCLPPLSAHASYVSLLYIFPCASHRLMGGHDAATGGQ